MAEREATQVLAQFAASLNYDDLPERVREQRQEPAARRAGLRARRRPGRGNRPGRGARGRAGAVARDQRHRRRPPVARRRDAAQRLPDHRRHHVRHAPRDAHPRHAGGGAAGAGDRRARRHFRPRPPGRARRRLRGRRRGSASASTIRSSAQRGWHGPGVLGPFGAAAAVGRLRGFDADTMARAFGLAGSQAAGTFAAWGTPTVKFHQCRGALSGLMAALLAEQKFVATRNSSPPRTAASTTPMPTAASRSSRSADLGKRWELEQIALRLWPSASLDAGHEHRAVRPGREAHARPGQGQEGARVAAARRCSTCTASFRTTRASSTR